MSNPYTYVGARPTESFVFVVAQAPGGPDLSAVTGAFISVQYPDDTVHSWDAVISAQSATGLTLTHLFQAGNVDIVGDYVARAVMQVSGGVIRSAPKPFSVIDQFQLSI